MKTLSDKLKTIVIIILSILSFILLLREYNGRSDRIIVTNVDTLLEVRYDTIFIKDRVIQTNYIYDTLIVNDTVYIKDEKKLYKDSTKDYRLEIEAVKLYDYSLDIYRSDSIKTVIKEIQKKDSFWKNRFYIGIGVGCQYGLINKQFDVGPQVQFGIRLY